MNWSVLLVFCLFTVQSSTALWCYECVSTQPGCGTPFNWYLYWTKICPEDDDVCVKITERKGVESVITRACMSTLKHSRTDIPADLYEGCRNSSTDVKLGHYVFNTIDELDWKRTFYDSTEWCMCFLDQRCNSSVYLLPSVTIIAISLLMALKML